MSKTLKSFARLCLPRSIRNHRIRSGPLRGEHIFTSWYDYPAAITGRTERPLLDWFAKNAKPGETWLDIGAHYGYTAIALSRLVGPRGRVFAFEPMLSTAGYLTQTRLINNMTQMVVLPLALSSATDLEAKQLPVTRGMVDNTLGGENWRETFLAVCLDWLWPRICGGRLQIDGIKIDVQGMEIDVLRGMRETLIQQHPKLVIELHHGVDRTELLALVESIGFSRHAMPIEPIQNEIEPMFVDDHSYFFTS